MVDPRKTAEWKRVRRAAIGIKEHVCYLCGNLIDADLKGGPLSIQVDHIIPVSMGGPVFDLDNLALTHKVCNQIKGSRVAGELVEERAETAFDSEVEFDKDYLGWMEG